MTALYNKYHSSKFAMYAINIVPEQDGQVAPMFQKAQSTIPALHTDSMSWGIKWLGKQNWGPNGVPVNLLIDSDGTIVSHLQFHTAKQREQADQAIDTLLKKNAHP